MNDSASERVYDHSEVIRISHEKIGAAPDPAGLLAALRFTDKPGGGRNNSSLIVRLSRAELDELTDQIAAFKNANPDLWVSPW